MFASVLDLHHHHYLASALANTNCLIKHSAVLSLWLWGHFHSGSQYNDFILQIVHHRLIVIDSSSWKFLVSLPLITEIKQFPLSRQCFYLNLIDVTIFRPFNREFLWDHLSQSAQVASKFLEPMSRFYWSPTKLVFNYPFAVSLVFLFPKSQLGILGYGLLVFSESKLKTRVIGPSRYGHQQKDIYHCVLVYVQIFSVLSLFIKSFYVTCTGWHIKILTWGNWFILSWWIQCGFEVITTQ